MDNYKVAIRAMKDLREILQKQRQQLADLGFEPGADTGAAYLEAMRMAISALEWEIAYRDQSARYHRAANIAFRTWRKKEPVFEHEVYGPTCVYCEIQYEKVDLGWRRREKITDPSFPNERVFEYRSIHEEDCPYRKFEELVGASQKENAHEELD